MYELLSQQHTKQFVMENKHKQIEVIEPNPDVSAASGLLQSEKCDDTIKTPTKNSTRTGIYRQVLLTAVVTPVMLTLAHSLAFTALIVPILRSENGTLHFTIDEGSWYTSTYSLASPFGSMIGGFMMDRYGRRITLATPLIPIIVAWIVMANAQSHIVLFTSRVFSGIFGGFLPPICQIYLAETADANFRGVTLNLSYVSLSLGFLLTFVLGAAMDWRHVAMCGIVLPIVTLIGTFIIPESPIWLLRNNHMEEAYQSFLWLRGDASIARNELNENLCRINQEREIARNTAQMTSFRDILKPSVLKPITIIFAFILLFNLTGTYLIIYYAIDILSQVNLTVNAYSASVILSAVRLVVTVGFCWLFTRAKRRNIYLIVGIGSTFSTLVLAAYLHNEELFPNETMNLTVTGTMLLIFIATNTGFMIAPGFMTGEMLPAKIRGRLAGYIYTYFSVVTFTLNIFFPNLNQHIGLTGVLFVFGLASLATTALIYFTVPETKGKTLLEIERYFQTHGWIYKSSRMNESRAFS